MFNILKINSITGATKELNYKEFLFPAGEVSVKLNANDYAYRELDLPNTIVARIQSSDDLLKLAMLKDALQKIDNHPINLFMPYVPYARQDRVCDKGESFSLAVLARFIASLGFAKVAIVDPHSDATPAAFEGLSVNLTVIKQLDVLNKSIEFIPTLMGSTLVSPDAGSNKKTSDAAAWLGHESFVRADKLRDLTNGKIKEITVYADDLKGRNVVILDDICENGGTFIGLAAELRKRNCGKVILYVTHGVFGGEARKLDVLENLFKQGGVDEIWTTDSYHRDLVEFTGLRFPNLHVLDLVSGFIDKI